MSFRHNMLDMKRMIAKNPSSCWNRRQAKKRRVYLSQRGKCCFCHRVMYPYFETAPIKMLAATKEHIRPCSHGGSNNYGNLKLSCYRCNEARKTIPFDAFACIVLAVSSSQLKKAVNTYYYFNLRNCMPSAIDPGCLSSL